MPRVVFIHPAIGRKPGRAYVRSWQMQPLGLAQLSALTPGDWERQLLDDRLIPVRGDEPGDLCAISIETYTARRGYEIAAAFRRRGVPVVMGGYHATACPDEVLQHADAVCIGEAEGVWARILKDARDGRMKGRYQAPADPSFPRVRPDRNLFLGQRYLPLELVETGRGCPHQCDFCSITAFHRHRYRRRPVEDIVEEVRSLSGRSIFFVDDNISADRSGLMELCRRLEPLGITWISQAALDVARDDELPAAMARSGCAGVLIGLESLTPERLQAMGKRTNQVSQYEAALDRLRHAGLAVYGTFVFGYPGDTREDFGRAVAFARRQRIFLAAFNHLVPFPGTPLYERAVQEGNLSRNDWWLDPEFRFGQTALITRPLSPGDIQACCQQARRSFYRWSSIAERALNLRANGRTLRRLGLFFGLNALMRREPPSGHGSG
jgi:radical SAM superfamily enzyme YgiQ (UPF0313 family)